MHKYWTVFCHNGLMFCTFWYKFAHFVNVCGMAVIVSKALCLRCCETGHYKLDDSSSNCQPCPAGTCAAKEGQTSCDPCPDGSACPQGCTSPQKCESWAEHLAVDNTRCQWSTEFYVTVSTVVVGKKSHSCLFDLDM